ncbi:sugar transferase [Tabrizicola sp. BL-A-41-H6]|uniref:sugar transferase n=1 Tax=Tabrizicola sp. BL-A-41-H6 TaxID=3421107 RepID=UPI003D673285
MRPGQRAVDIVASSAGLVVLSPLILIGILGVKLTSPGPVFYRAARAGRGGQTFFMLKLRTMRHTASDGPKITAPQDRRVTPFGQFLRTSKIDEMPQLFNVLKGDMSIVGPRPEDPDIVRDLYGAAEFETLRARPGLTSPGTIWYYENGEAQLDPTDVMRNYATVMRHKLGIDSEYLRTATVASDFMVMLATAGVILKKVFSRPRPTGDASHSGRS